MATQTDYMLVIGLVIGLFAIPAAVSALSDSRPPRVAAISVLVAGGLIVFALVSKPGGYAVNDIPQAVTRVVAAIVR